MGDGCEAHYSQSRFLCIIHSLRFTVLKALHVDSVLLATSTNTQWCYFSISETMFSASQHLIWQVFVFFFMGTIKLFADLYFFISFV